VILLIVLVLAAPWIVAHTPLRDTAINLVLASPSVTASSEGASFGWLSPLAVDGLDLKSANNHVEIRVQGIAADRSLWQLATSAPDLGTITIEKPHVLLEWPLDVDIESTLASSSRPSPRLSSTRASPSVSAARTNRPSMSMTST
jgi:hypothetical protein